MVAPDPPPPEPPEALRLRFEHSLQIRRIWLDRMLIGALLVVAGLIANVVLEKYKADRGQSQFFLDKRLGAATDVRRALSEVTTLLFAISRSPCEMAPFNPTDLQALRGALAKLAHELNSSSLLFGENYLEEANRVVNIYAGVASKPEALTCDARPFLAEVAQFLTHQTKRQVAPDEHPQWQRFAPIVMSIEGTDALGAGVYFVRNLESWQAARKGAASAPLTR